MSDIEEFEDFIEYVYDNPYDYVSRRYIRDASNPMEYYDDDQFRDRFRFRKNVVLYIILPLLELEDNMNYRGLPVSPLIQLLVALKFYASGLFQIDCGDLAKLSQPTVSKIVARISKRLALKIGLYIKFPAVHERRAVTQKFYRMAGFPGAIGCIDCTHVNIKNPKRENGEAFRNRKRDFSINVQIVCGPNMEIYDIVARWPGSVHDSRIFASSRCCLRFEEGDLQGILIGDSGYAQTTYMYTPVLNPTTIPQQRYNRAHISTRNIIERLNGVLKRRFYCLGKKLQNKITNVPNIIVACAILHNIGVMTREPMPDPAPVEEVPLDVIRDNDRGSIIRAAFIARHFNY